MGLLKGASFRSEKGRGSLNSQQSTSSYGSVATVNQDPFVKDEDELFELLEDMVTELDVTAVFDNDWTAFRNLCRTMKNNYNDNPFHNWEHGFSVANMATLFLVRNPELMEQLGDEYTLAFFIAALGHDLDHPGNDNNFIIQSKDELAEKYNHKSVLENHHANTLIDILHQQKNDVFSKLEKEKRMEIIEFMKDLIIATDMTFHLTHMSTLNTVDYFPKTMRHEEDRQKLLRVIMHACDLSGQVMTLPIAISWEERISAEMMNQARKSESLGIEVPDHIIKLGNQKNRAEMQLGFIDGVLSPLWSEIGRVFPSMSPFHNHLIGVIRNHYHILSTDGEEEAQKYDANYWDVEALTYISPNTNTPSKFDS
uniref:PDEase domain-containing protein n=1 Tax=Aplanochytrium stocchinoi TaxID=215587 RepID=A0A7S3PSH8_9STRA|mmetsp:Transcript_10887/g.12476  ORF Transcript_10887/g.12476 Transcript_10887/m.12476 type:complete len:368 (+) Transcript_10887:245-1348(+)|eukprot:CAMPEP_0204828688 /NCGR_PEP_ID=MMETSP1346-20131115/6590_1 /ASSEMBLY_ACC=CAM_ASM_000771 /TAXON_ID=215587 /ORGANISM="Aplanochytrium stocchinoi, Strain GSBS06" /LENGTH=367 /DNA_ID=CAMNT_0051957961 /DNA_START=232 /DNA_END=1335 /DNA_ORIENTATION=-